MNRKIRKIVNNRGMTLIEILFAVFVLSFGIMGALSYFTTSKVALEMSRYKTTAVVHAEYILENMRTKATLAAIISTNWANFASNAGLNTLPLETITVTYADEGDDPLNITVTVGWTIGSRSSNISLVTEMTK